MMGMAGLGRSFGGVAMMVMILHALSDIATSST
jgi:hypothetical protein